MLTSTLRGRLPAAVLPVLFVVAMSACSGSAGSTSPATESPSSSAASASAPGTTPAGDVSSITIKEFKFTPKSLTLAAGTAVTWTNEEDSLHTVTAGEPDAPTGLFDSGEIDTGVDFQFTFKDPGTFPFFCARHDFMRGEVVVTP